MQCGITFEQVKCLSAVLNDIDNVDDAMSIYVAGKAALNLGVCVRAYVCVCACVCCVRVVCVVCVVCVCVCVCMSACVYCIHTYVCDCTVHIVNLCWYMHGVKPVCQLVHSGIPLSMCVYGISCDL